MVRDRSMPNDDAHFARVYDIREDDRQAGAGQPGETITVNGVITRLLEAGLPGGGWLEFEVDSGGERSQWSRMVSGSVADGTLAARIRLYEVCRAVRIRYRVVRLESPIAGKQTIKKILDIWIEMEKGSSPRAAGAL